MRGKIDDQGKLHIERKSKSGKTYCLCSCPHKEGAACSDLCAKFCEPSRDQQSNTVWLQLCNGDILTFAGGLIDER